MTHSLVCSQFRPNFWRPSICAYCYRPKDKHIKNSNRGEQHTRKGRTLPHLRGSNQLQSNEWHHSLDVIPRSATVSSGSPMKERIMHSEPPADLVEEVQDFPRRIGVVKPYAVVELTGKTWTSITTPDHHSPVPEPHHRTTPGVTTDQKFFTLPADTRSKPNSPRINPKPHGTTSSSFTAVVVPNTETQSLPRTLKGRSGQTSSAHSNGRIIPKRKAPPPPDIATGRRRKAVSNKRSSSVPPQFSTHYIVDESFSDHELVEDRAGATEETKSITTAGDDVLSTGNSSSQSSTVELRHKENSPPVKPPRTESTFITDAAAHQDSRIPLVSCLVPPKRSLQAFPAAASKKQYSTYCSSVGPLKYSSFESSSSAASDYEPLRKPGLSFSTMSLVTANNCSVSEQLHELFNETLSTISETHLKKLLEDGPQDLWNVDWSDITVRTDDKGSHQLFYHMHPITVEGYDEVVHDTEIKISKSLGLHLNLSLAKGILPQTPTDLIDILPEAGSYVIRDYSPELVPLNKKLSLWRRVLNPDEYERNILLTLLQILRAMKHLYSNGVVHRDLGIDTIYTASSGPDCGVIKLGGFQYGLYRPGPLSATTFVYAFQELHWLGGADTRLPPEIMDTPENSHALDYANTDCFAIGCLVYELITGSNPFDEKPQLIYVGYSDDDLPVFPKTTKMSNSLQTLAHRLLRRDPHKRLGINDALTLVQAMLWLPSSWFQESVSNVAIQSHLLLLKGKLMTEIALSSDSNSELSLETALKSDFLASCSASDIVRAFAVFHQQI